MLRPLRGGSTLGSLDYLESQGGLVSGVIMGVTGVTIE